MIENTPIVFMFLLSLVSCHFQNIHFVRIQCYALQTITAALGLSCYNDKNTQLASLP